MTALAFDSRQSLAPLTMGVLTLAALLGGGPLALATSLNIDFSVPVSAGGYGVPDNTFGAAAGQAGLWNSVESVGSHSLLNLSGQSAGVTLELSADSWGKLAAVSLTGATATSWSHSALSHGAQGDPSQALGVWHGLCLTPS